MKRPRLRRWAKWACTLVAVLVVGVAVMSRKRAPRFEWYSDGGLTCRGGFASGGLLCIYRLDGYPIDMNAQPPKWTVTPVDCWYWGLWGDDTMFRTSARWHAGVLYSRRYWGWTIGISLVYPVLLTVGLAALLWYADRGRPGPFACKKCNYDRRGLPVGVNCPECGTVPERG